MRTLPLLFALLPAQALASGYFYSDSGVIASTRGGAWVATADTRFAQRYNPAGLMNLDRAEFDLGMSFVQQNVQFQRIDDDGTEHPVVENQSAPFNVPEFGFATPIGDNMAFAFGLYTPYAPSSEYDAVGAQRYTVIDTLILQGNIGPSFAWQPIKQIKVGAGLQWGFLTVGQRLKANIALIESTEAQNDPANDIAVDVRVSDLFTPSFNLGVIVEPIEQLAIGISVQPPAGYKARGRLEFDAVGGAYENVLTPPEGSTEAIWSDEDVALNLALPLEARFGFAVRPIEGLEIELAAHFVNWKSVDEILIEDIDVSIETTLPGLEQTTLPPTIALPASFQSATTFALGIEGQIGDIAEIRGGGFYEPAAVAKRNLAVGTIDMNKVQVGLGGTVKPGDHMMIDIAANMLFFPETRVRNSAIQQINALNTENDPTLGPPAGVIVGNGTYNANGWTAGIGLRWALGAVEEG